MKQIYRFNHFRFVLLTIAIFSPILLQATSHEVIVSNGNYTPKDIIIKAGDTIIWTQIEGTHNVNGSQDTFPDNPESFGNGEAASGDWTYSFLFTMPGSYDYQCDPTPLLAWLGQ